MPKIRLTEAQALMLKRLENKKSKHKVLKINEDQYSRLFKGGFKTSDKVEKNFDNNDLAESKDKKELNSLEFAREIIVFIKDIITNPKSVPFSKYWKELGVNKGQLFRLLKKEGLLEEQLSESPEEDQHFKSFSSKKVGFRKAIKELFKSFKNKDSQLNEFQIDYNDPTAGHPMNDEPDHVENNGPIKAQKKIFKVIHHNNGSDGLTILKNLSNNSLYVITIHDIEVGTPNDTGETVLAPYEDIEGNPDGETVENYVNDQQLNINDSGVWKKNKSELTLITPTVKKTMLKYWGDDIKLLDILNQIPESTGAASSGAYVGGGNFNGPIQKNTGNSPEKAMSTLNEDMATNVFQVAWNLNDNGGDTSPFISEFHKVQQFMNMLASKGIHNGVKVSKTNDKGAVIKSFTYDFDGNDWEKTTPIDESTTTVSVGGDSGTFAFDAPVGDGSDFWNAGNKQNKKMPVVKRAIGENTQILLPEGFKAGQIYKNGVGRRKIEKIDILRGIIYTRQWGDGNPRDLKLNKSEFGGWILIENTKKIIKITEKQLKKIIESDNATSTSYPNGEFVDFDDCVKFNNNTTAQDGGCSQGAVDGVAKYSKTKSSVIASETQTPKKKITEALKLRYDKANNMLAVISDSGDAKTASKETYTSKNILKANGFKWSGTNWIISADQLEVAKQTLTKVNKVEYFIEKLDDLGELLQGSADTTGGKSLVNAQLDQYITDIANATDEVAASAEIRRYLDFHSSFHQYSFNNRILIYIQRKDATRVASFNGWKEKSRRVKKGAKGIKVLVPIFRKGENPGKLGSPEIDLTDLDSLTKAMNRPQPVNFKVGNVFDISDTEAINSDGDIPEKVEWWGSNEPSEIADKLFDNLKVVSDSLGIKVTSDDARGGEKGFSAGDHINLTSDVKGAGRASTMAHEMAHELMHWKKKSMYYIGDENIRNKALLELQAETVSYVVLKHYGIPVKHHAKYLALWGANKEKILKYLKNISDVADFIIKEIDKVAKYETSSAGVAESINTILKEIGF